MRLVLTLRRRERECVDLAVTTDATVTVGALARALNERDPEGPAVTGDVTLASRGEPLPSDLTIADSRLQRGAMVEIVASACDAGGGSPQGRPAASLLVVAGPRGKDGPFPLRTGSNTIGRSSANDVQLLDRRVSRLHARLIVTDTVEVVDSASAKGVLVNGERVERAALRPDDLVTLGDTVVRVVHGGAASPDPGGNGELFNRSPQLVPAYDGAALQVPEPPSRPARQPLSWTPLVAPLLLGPAMYLLTDRLVTLLFVALSPLLALGNYWERRWTQQRAYQEAVDSYCGILAALHEQLEALQEQEVAARLAEHRAAHELAEVAAIRGPLLWSARPDRPGFLELRLGLGATAARNSVEMPRRIADDPALRKELQDLGDAASTVSGVPIVAVLPDIGAVGVVGPKDAAPAALRALLAQLVCRHSPAEVVVAAAVPDAAAQEWSWLKWLPHTASAHSPLPDEHLAAGPAAVGRLVAALEELLEQRRQSLTDKARPLPSVVLLVDDAAPVERSRLVTLTEHGPASGLHVLWLAAAVSRLPAACRAFIDVTATGGDDSVGLELEGRRVEPVTVERISVEAAEALARSMAPLLDAGARVLDQSDLPQSVPLLSVVGADMATAPAAVLEEWRAGGSYTPPDEAGIPSSPSTGLHATVGIGSGQGLALDLREHGPHALVGGTTGAGKSEFLQTWVTALALAHSPARLTFLFVDYKGEAAFGECVQLPHSVGLVSDLNPHLVRRALRSLRAELRHREHALKEHQAKDLSELEQRGVLAVPPRLVIVVDEFAALVKEIPEFVDGVVDVAQRGRSLGLHLILATQRPAGVVRENLRANTNLRIALRMADPDDSVDVLGIPDAAFFDPSLPGRAMAKLGPGRVTAFQSAYVGGRTPDVAPPPPITVAEQPFGAGQEWRPAPAETPAPPAAQDVEATLDAGPDMAGGRKPSDLARLAANIMSAHRESRIPLPRRPWLPELDTSYSYDLLYGAKNRYQLEAAPKGRSDSELVFGVRDDPAHQRRLVASFVPDRDGAMVVYGTGGAGKSTFLRTLALAAARTPDGGPCHVYGLDFGAQGLRMLDPHPLPTDVEMGTARDAGPSKMPHVGAIIAGDDDERVVRLLRMLRQMIDERALRYSKHNASTISEYRKLAKHKTEPRILLLVDGAGAFRSAYEAGLQAHWFEVFHSIVADGRSVGVHAVMSADRSTALPSSLSALVQRRLVLRMAGDGHEAALLQVPSGAFTPDTPPGRGFLDGAEVQVAVPRGSTSTTEQARRLRAVATNMHRGGTGPAVAPARIGRLPERISLDDLPVEHAGMPTLGMEDLTLDAVGFRPTGTLLITGPPGSGRTSLLATLALSFARFHSQTQAFHMGSRRSLLLDPLPWQDCAKDPADVAALSDKITAALQQGQVTPVLVVVENVPDFLGTAADSALQKLVKAVRDAGALLVADGEVSALISGVGLPQQLKSAKHGIALQPDQTDGDNLYKISFPRINRAQFPPGRGFYVRGRHLLRVQCALPPEEPEAGGAMT